MANTLIPDMQQFFNAIPQGTIGWTIYCPEEGVQLGGVFDRSEEAFAAAKLHNQFTRHNAAVAPFFNNPASEGLSDDQTMLPWAFCFRYDGRPCFPQMIYAPSAEGATMTAEGLVGLLNGVAPLRGYQPVFSASAGACPAV